MSKTFFFCLVGVGWVVFSIAGCGSKMKSYENYADRYKIQYPLDWKVQEEAMGASVTFLSPQEGDKDKFQENVNIVIQDFGEQKVTLKEYSEAVKNEIKQILPGSQVVASGDIKLSKIPGQKMITTVQAPEMKLKMLQSWMIKGNKVYMITFTAEESQYALLEKTVDKILQSFKIIK